MRHISPGPCFNIETVFPSMGISIIKWDSRETVLSLWGEFLYWQDGISIIFDLASPQPSWWQLLRSWYTLTKFSLYSVEDQGMVGCSQGPKHNLIKCWPRSMVSYGPLGHNELTFVVLKSEYSRITRSVPLLLMPWLLASAGYWSLTIVFSVQAKWVVIHTSSTRKKLFCLYLLNVMKW